MLVHRPGLEHTRLTPANAEELLFDDVIWVKRAKEEHDAFCSVMRDRGVEVYDAEALLPRCSASPRRATGSSTGCWTSATWACIWPARRREWARRRHAARRWPTYLIGGVTKADLADGEGLTYDSSAPGDMLLPPLPNFIFQRDPSCWIYDGVTLNPMTKPARRPETVFMQAIYRYHPMFAETAASGSGTGTSRQDWGRATVEGGDVMPIGNGAVLIGMGERTAPQAVTMIARELFKAGSARLVLAVKLPMSRHYMHLDTVMTMVDRDAVTLFPEVVDGARVWSIRPGDEPELPVVEPFDGGVVDALKHALELDDVRVIPTGGDPFETEREQWDDGNNVVCLEPGVVDRLRPQRRHQHPPAQGGDRGDHDLGLRARPRPRRLALHDLPARSATRPTRGARRVQPAQPQLPEGDRLHRERARSTSCGSRPR